MTGRENLRAVQVILHVVDNLRTIYVVLHQVLTLDPSCNCMEDRRLKVIAHDKLDVHNTAVLLYVVDKFCGKFAFCN